MIKNCMIMSLFLALTACGKPSRANTSQPDNNKERVQSIGQLPDQPQNMDFEKCSASGQGLADWHGARPQIGYQTTCSQDSSGKNWAALIQSSAGHSDFGAIVQCIKADKFKGHLNLSGSLKTLNVANGFAGLWMRADGADGSSIAFDNMHDRGIVGTTDYQTYNVLLDIPDGAVDICYGSLLVGDGSLWIENLNLTLQ